MILHSKFKVLWCRGIRIYLGFGLGIWLVLILSLLSFPLWAVSSQSLTLKKTKKHLFKDQKLSIHFQEQSYYNSTSEFYTSTESIDEASVFRLQYNNNLSGKFKKWNINVESLYTAYDKENYLHLYDLYFHHKFSRSGSLQHHIKLGKVKYSDFKNEDLWNLGLWQPRTTWDRLESQHEGLTGLFYESQGEKVIWKLYALAGFIPEMVKTKVVDKKIVSKNPWFVPPPSEIDIEQTEGKTPIYFSIQIPPEEEIVNHQGIGTYLGYENSKNKLFNKVRWGYAYKPINQILLGAPVKLSLPESDVQNLAVDIRPRILYHHLTSLEVESSPAKSHWVWTNNVTFEKPIRDETPDSWLTQETEEATFFTSTLSMKFKKFFGYLSLLKLWGGDKPHRGPIDIQTPLFESRFLWKSAVRLGLTTHKMNWASYRHKFQLSGTVDWEQRGGVFSVNMNTIWSSSLQTNLGFDAIGLIDEEEPTVSRGFVRDYRSNDRIKGELIYVF